MWLRSWVLSMRCTSVFYPQFADLRVGELLENHLVQELPACEGMLTHPLSEVVQYAQIEIAFPKGIAAQCVAHLQVY
jgi:hypothetical protein